ncbi:MAG: DUF6775 family putative metallopeptidase [Endomicrobiia bacterium]
MTIPSFIYLYDGAKTQSLNLNEISQYLKNIFKKSKIKIREEFVTYHTSNLCSKEKEKIINYLAKEIAKIRVRNLQHKNKNTVSEPLAGEVEYERNLLLQRHNAIGILYDGFKLMSIYNKLLNKKEANLSHCHIIFTNQLFGSWDEYDMRYHARVSIYGFPSIISTTGIVEAPAKPREFYLKKQLGVDIYSLKEEFKNRFIDYNDPRMTEVMKGYVLQAIFYHMTGNPFCEDKNCRLYNAHWQQEVIQAQLNTKNEFCQQHQKFINQIKYNE